MLKQKEAKSSLKNKDVIKLLINKQQGKSLFKNLLKEKNLDDLEKTRKNSKPKAINLASKQKILKAQLLRKQKKEKTLKRRKTVSKKMN